MDFLDQIKSGASSMWGDVVTTGREYVSEAWADTKQDFLGGNPVAKAEAEKTAAAIPGAQDSRVAGKGVGATPKGGINWSAVGVGVAVLALVLQ